MDEDLDEESLDHIRKYGVDGRIPLPPGLLPFSNPNITQQKGQQGTQAKHGPHGENCSCSDSQTHEHTFELVAIPNPYLHKNPQLAYQQAIEAWRMRRDSATRGFRERGSMRRKTGPPQPKGAYRPLKEDPERLVSTFVDSIEQGSGRCSRDARTDPRTKQSANCSTGSKPSSGPSNKQP